MSLPSAASRSSFETYLHISFAREAAGKCRSIITRTSLSVAAVITPETMSSLVPSFTEARVYQFLGFRSSNESLTSD